MNNRQINQFGSFRTLRAVLADQTATSLRPAFKAAMAAFDNQFEEINNLKVTQTESLDPAILSRDLILAAMQDSVLGLAGAVANYAHDHDLPVLAADVRVSPATFNRLRREHRVTTTRHLLRAIEPVVGQLGDYGVTPADIDDLKAKIAAAEAVLPAARRATVDRKTATIRLAVAFAAVKGIIRERLDPLARSVRKSHPEFYERYLAARQVVDRPGARQAGGGPDTVAPPGSDATLPPDSPPATGTPAKLAA